MHIEQENRREYISLTDVELRRHSNDAAAHERWPSQEQNDMSAYTGYGTNR
jgi:hypothetical protein